MNSQFTILNPCSKRWTELSGSGRARFCETCQTPVRDFARYSPKEWKKLWKENNGHVCGILPRSPVEEPRSRRAILLGALLSFVSPLFAQTGRVRFRVLDTSGAVIPDAEVALLDADNRPIHTQDCDSAGETTFIDLPVGDKRFQVSRSGFQTMTLSVNVALSADEMRVVVLRVGEMNMGTFVEAQQPPDSKSPQDLPGNFHLKKRKHWWIFW